MVFKIVLGLFILFILIALIAMPKAASAANKLVEEHLGLLKKGDIAGAYQLTSREFKDVLTLDEYKKFISQFPFLTRNKRHKFTKRSFSDNIGKIKAVFISENSVINIVLFTLVKEDRQWKIISISINPKDS